MVQTVSSVGVMEAAGSSGAVKPVSLLVISHSYPPVLGGSEVELQRACEALMHRGHRVQVLCAGGPPMPGVENWVKNWVDPLGVPVRIIGGRCPARWREYWFAAAVALAILRDRRKYDAVYFLMQGLHLAAGLPAARLRRLPIMMKFSGSSIITMLTRSFLGRLELRWLNAWAKRIMVLNEGMTEEALAANLDPHRLVWMPNPVDVRQFAPAGPGQRAALRRDLQIPADAKVVLFVGRLAPEKELPSLIRAFVRVQAMHKSAQLVLIGDGPDRAPLERCAAEAGLPGSAIRFAGRLPVASVIKWLQASDAFALVSSNEGFPCSLVEAMAVGLPSVVSRIPANVQLVVHNGNGLIAPVRDETSIADALDILLSDESLRRNLGAAARMEVVEKYSVEKVVARYEHLFQEVLAG